MRRGDIVITVTRGDYGKPRPAVVIQSDQIPETESVLVCLMTTTLREVRIFRLSVGPGEGTGLREPSQVQVDKIMAVPREKVGKVIGRLPPETMADLDRRLLLITGLGN